MKLYIYFDQIKGEDVYSYRQLTGDNFNPELTKVLEFTRRLALQCIHYRMRFVEGEMVPYTWLFGDVIKGGEKDNFSTWFDERFGNWLDPQRNGRINEYLQAR